MITLSSILDGVKFSKRQKFQFALTLSTPINESTDANEAGEAEIMNFWVYYLCSYAYSGKERGKNK